jgi:hypothetical protein
MGRFVIAGYRPRADQGPALRALVKRHWPALRDQALVSARTALVMRPPTARSSRSSSG